ncbi:NEK protein kinase [Phytophthora megakarya]|uniref:NEK protein kinase n=1 Tax=Phytophthora megakarya TaxID=4795 RepID=A0A225X4E3_9STRA|nr:NEK protein kinase [Phytophthora megakarya]
MCTLSRWLISLLGNEEWTNDDENNDPPVVAAQKILLAAEKAGVSVVTHLSAAALTSGAGVEVCELLDALSAAVVCDEKYCTTPPEYPNEPVETLESCDELDVTDDEQHSTTDTGELTTTLEYDEDEAFSRWVVVKEENQVVDDDKENVMIHTDIDPVAWELERRRMLPKLHAVFHDKLQLRPTESSWRVRSWRVRLDLIQDRSGSIVAGQEGLRCEIAQVQASRQKQADQLERYEKQLNHHFLRSRRLYHENTARLVKTHSEMQSVQQTEAFLTFESIQFDAELRVATFQFHFCGGRRFQATMNLAGPLQHVDGTSAVVRNALLHIGLCILPWFWMGYNCKYIHIEAGYLNSEQVHFWEEFYQDVLSEYLYLHGLDRNRLHIVVDVPASEALPVLPDRKLEQQGKAKVLVPLGGGKDSLVVYQLLSSSDMPCAWLHVGDQPQEFERSWRFKKIVEMTQNRTGASAFRFEHNMDDKTWEREVAGTRYQPAGHPWAALVAFDSVLAAILGDFTHVAVGNERSANYGNNIVHEGRSVNHQYDKSFDFESRAHTYIRKYLVEDLHYFSALQHLWEVQIARTFANRSLEDSENFLPVFLSCNEAPDAQLLEIFGENLFEKQSMFPEFLTLLDEEGVKPMECVGTDSETWLSLYLALQAHGHCTFLKIHEREIRRKGAELMHLLSDYNSEHLLPAFLEPTLCQPVMSLGP